MVFKWRDNHTILVIDLLKNKECLWNTKSENYRNTNCRDKALKDIVKQLRIPDLTTDDVKRKIKSIRSRYAAELGKVLKSEKSGAGRLYIYVPKLFWFKQADLFLRPVCTPRVSSSTKATTMDAFDDCEHETETEIMPETQCSGGIKREQPETEHDDHLTESVVNPTRSEQPNVRKSRKRRFKRASELRNIKTAIEKLSNDCKEPEDEFDLFTKSLAVQLRNMPLHRALLCQQKLQQIIVDERLYQIENGIEISSYQHLPPFPPLQPTSSPSTYSTHSSSMFSDSSHSHIECETNGHYRDGMGDIISDAEDALNHD